MPSKVEVPGNTTATAGGRPGWQELLLRAPGGPIPRRVALTLLIAAGAGLTVYSGYIHLYLWGRQPYPYRTIATIGPLFLLQGIVGILIGALVVITRRFFAVLLAAGFMVVSVAALGGAAAHRGRRARLAVADGLVKARPVALAELL